MAGSVCYSAPRRFDLFSRETELILPSSDMEIYRIDRWDAVKEYFKDFQQLFELVSALSFLLSYLVTSAMSYQQIRIALWALAQEKSSG
jgi:hypothetical protein